MELEDQRKRYLAVWQLKEEAGHWWDTVKICNDVANMSWAKFKELFNEKYVPPQARERLREQFVNLQQGNMTVSEYVRKFDELSRYAPGLIDRKSVV